MYLCHNNIRYRVHMCKLASFMFARSAGPPGGQKSDGYIRQGLRWQHKGGISIPIITFTSTISDESLISIIIIRNVKQKTKSCFAYCLDVCRCATFQDSKSVLSISPSENNFRIKLMIHWWTIGSLVHCCGSHLQFYTSFTLLTHIRMNNFRQERDMGMGVVLFHSSHWSS